MRKTVHGKKWDLHRRQITYVVTKRNGDKTYFWDAEPFGSVDEILLAPLEGQQQRFMSLSHPWAKFTRPNPIPPQLSLEYTRLNEYIRQRVDIENLNWWEGMLDENEPAYEAEARAALCKKAIPLPTFYDQSRD